MKTLRLILLLASIGLSALLAASAQTVDDTLRQIREAGLEGIAGTMPENASLLGSFAFERLERKLPGIYGSAKQTFRLAGDSWDQERNAGKPPSAPREELGHTLRIMLRNQFLYQVEAFLPDLSRGVYSEADRRRIKELLVGTPPPADGTLQTPNNALAEHFKAYLQNLLVDGIPEPQPIFERLLGPLDKRGDGAPLGGGLAPKWGRLSLAIKSGGALVQPVEIKIKYLRAGIGGHEQEDSFHTNPGIYVVPTGKWNVTAESAGLASQTQEAEIREGAVTTLAFALTAAPAAGTPAASRGNRGGAASRAVAPLSPGELALIGHYQRAGAKVVDFDPQALARAWQALPDNYPDILRPHGQLLATMLTPRGGRGFAADMTGHAANPALNDPRLMVKLEAVRNGQPAEIAVEAAKFTEDIVWCVSQWVNAMRNLTETTFEPLANVQVNDAFFTRVEARYWTEDRNTSTERVNWKHYVAWERSAWDAAARSTGAPPRFFSADPSGEVADLTVKLIYGPRGTRHGRFVPNDTTHRGVIEIYMGEGSGDVLAQADFAAASANPAKYSFRRIFLHEFGHYLGLRHLPSAASAAEQTVFANGAMSRAYTLIGDGVLPVDAMMLTHASYLSLDVRGRRCEGLMHEPDAAP